MIFNHRCKLWYGLLVVLGLIRIVLYAQSDNRHQIDLHYQRAQAALSANQPEAAANEFKAIVKVDPKNAEAYANLGVIAFQQGTYSQAVQFFTEALKIEPSLWDAKAFLGLSDIRVGHSKEGESLVQDSFPHIANKRLKLDAGLELVRSHQASKSLDQVLYVIRDLQQMGPDDPEVLYVAYRAYSDLAAQAVATLSQTAPNSGRLHQILAQAAMTQDDFTGAIAQYRKAVEIDPQLPGVHYELGRAILTNAQDVLARRQAEHEFETELASDPRDFNSEYELGEVYRLGSDFKLAEKHYMRAVELRPDFVNAQLALGDVLTAQGRPEEAIPYLVEATRLDPNNEVAHYRLARIYREMGRAGQANSELELFKKLRQEHASSQGITRQVDNSSNPH
jgi:cytochrome c-type biogenesis protein CcmH/NrfG